MSTPRRNIGNRTWIEIDSKAVRQNIKTVSRLTGSKVKIWAVVKSNAYGHGIFVIPKIVEQTEAYGFCVDSVIEGFKLREIGIKKPILVLGFTPKESFKRAARENIIITVSNKDVLNLLSKEKNPPRFHLKIDTGMHRQGFFLNDIDEVIKILKDKKLGLAGALIGVYTHFSSAKDLNYPGYTDKQVGIFKSALSKLESAGFKNLMHHAAATGGALINPAYHFDAVRIGIGTYGLWPSKELEIQKGSELDFLPALSWHTFIGEVKDVRAGSYIGYDMAERVRRDSRVAILPVGYWHGFPRALSGIGSVLILGKRARVLGRVSMDMIAVDVTGIKCKFGDKATLIGSSGKERVSAGELAALVGTSHYEIVTRLNPLIERIAV